MPTLTELAARAERHIGPLASTVLRLRRGTPGQPEAIEPEEERRARNSWWGADERWYAGGTPPRQHNRITVVAPDRPLESKAQNVVLDRDLVARSVDRPAMNVVRCA